MIRLALICLLLAIPANALTIRFPESNGQWVNVSDNTGRIVITDSAGFGVTLSDSYGTLEGNTRTIRAHGGGYVYKALFMIRRGNERVRLLCDKFDLSSLTQGCTSAATLWLGAKNVCIGRNAVFNFHGASMDIFDARPDYDATAAMAAIYPPAIRREFLRKWSKVRGASTVRVTAFELKQIEPELDYCNGSEA